MVILARKGIYCAQQMSVEMISLLEVPKIASDEIGKSFSLNSSSFLFQSNKQISSESQSLSVDLNKRISIQGEQLSHLLR